MNHKRNLILLTLIFAALTFLYCYEVKAQALTNENLLRFHIIASSDSPYDQQIKLCLRDEIIDTVNRITVDAENAETATAMVAAHQEEILKEANDFLKSHGVSYQAKVTVGKSIFPTKSYENITLPAGKYMALKIILGEGKGKNWWCVLYPSLCFIKFNDNTSVAYLEEDSTENENQIVPANAKPQQIMIRSRLWELLCK